MLDFSVHCFLCYVYILWFLWMAQWDMMVLHSCSVLPMDSLARVRVRSSLGLESALCSDCSPLSTDLSQGSCVHWCSGTGINDGTGFPDVLLN